MGRAALQRCRFGVEARAVAALDGAQRAARIIQMLKICFQARVEQRDIARDGLPGPLAVQLLLRQKKPPGVAPALRLAAARRALKIDAFQSAP